MTVASAPREAYHALKGEFDRFTLKSNRPGITSRVKLKNAAGCLEDRSHAERKTMGGATLLAFS
jgi:hypothetical protein